jgi:saccharopine dehydrogenase-like NADP-dependent oxidoreductase
MNRTVGFTTSIAAQLVLTGRVKKTGLLNPVRDVPAADVVRELEKRGMNIEKRIG